MSRYLKWIAHRGNRFGPNPEKENSPDHLRAALTKGYHVEMDVWWVEESKCLMLGHDRPTYPLPLDLLTHPRVYVHCKNIKAGAHLRKYYPQAHCFGHDKDEFVFTTQGELWTYPGKEITPESIVVMPEWEKKWERFQHPECRGVCSDYLPEFRLPPYLFGKCVAVHSDYTTLFDDLRDDPHTIYLPDLHGDLTFLDVDFLTPCFRDWEKSYRESLTQYDYLVLNKPISEKFHLRMFSDFEGEKPDALKGLYKASLTVVPDRDYLIYDVRGKRVEEVRV